MGKSMTKKDNPDRLRIAIQALEEIRDVARLSDGVEFYAMLAERALARIEGDE